MKRKLIWQDLRDNTIDVEAIGQIALDVSRYHIFGLKFQIEKYNITSERLPRGIGIGRSTVEIRFSRSRKELLTKTTLDGVIRFFYKGIYHEDMEFTPRALWYARKVKVVDKILYNYYQGNLNSIVHKPNIKKCYDLVFVSEQTIHFADTVVNNILCKKALLNLAALELNSCLRKLNQYDKITKREFISKLKNNQQYIKKMKN